MRSAPGDSRSAFQHAQHFPSPSDPFRFSYDTTFFSSSHLAPLQPELVDEDDAVALRYGEPGAVRAEAEASDDVVLGTLVCGFSGELVSLLAVFVVQSNYPVRLGQKGRQAVRERQTQERENQELVRG